MRICRRSVTRDNQKVKSKANIKIAASFGLPIFSVRVSFSCILLWASVQQMQWISTCVIVCVCAYTIISEILLRRIKLFNDLFQLFETPSRQMSASSFLIIDKVKVSF